MYTPSVRLPDEECNRYTIFILTALARKHYIAKLAHFEIFRAKRRWIPWEVMKSVAFAISIMLGTINSSLISL